MTSNPYAVLGVEKTATDSEIKAAFRKKAIELHPDKNPDKDTTKEFSAVKEAFDAIETKEKRDKLNQPRNPVHTVWSSDYYPQDDGGVDISWLFKQQQYHAQKMEEIARKHQRNLATAIKITIEDLFSNKEVSYEENGKLYSANLTPRWGSIEEYAKIQLKSSDGETLEKYLHLNLGKWILYPKTGDLETTAEVPYWDLVLGGKISVTLPSGKTGSLNLLPTDGGDPPEILRVVGAGLEYVGAVGMSRGNARFNIVPVYPKPTEEQVELLTKIKEAFKDQKNNE